MPPLYVTLATAGVVATWAVVIWIALQPDGLYRRVRNRITRRR
jgi:hypothetical protein